MLACYPNSQPGREGTPANTWRDDDTKWVLNPRAQGQLSRHFTLIPGSPRGKMFKIPLATREFWMDGSKLTGHWRWSGGRGTEKKRLSQNYDDRNLANGHVCQWCIVVLGLWLTCLWSVGILFYFQWIPFLSSQLGLHFHGNNSYQNTHDFRVKVVRVELKSWVRPAAKLISSVLTDG